MAPAMLDELVFAGDYATGLLIIEPSDPWLRSNQRRDFSRRQLPV